MPQNLFSCQSCLSLGTAQGSAAPQSPLEPDLGQTFANLRGTLMASLSSQVIDGATPLVGWRPNEDLGSVVLESWAYVGDVLGFYSSAIKAESYLQRADQRRSQRRLAALLGYQPRPAVGSVAEIAAIVGAAQVPLQKTAYRGALPPGSPAQIFETGSSMVASQQANEYAVAPVRANKAAMSTEGVCLIDPATAAPVRGRPVAFIWLDQIIKAHPSQIIDVAPVRQADGNEYVAMRVADGPEFSANVERENVALISPSQRAFVCTSFFDLPLGPIVAEGSLDSVALDIVNDVLSLLPGGYAGMVNQTINVLALEDKTQSGLYLDGVYRSINAGDLVILQVGEALKVHRVTRVDEEAVALASGGDEPPQLPITRLVVNPEVKSSFYNGDQYSRLVIHYNMHDIGRMTRVALTELQKSDVVGNTLPLEGIHDVPTSPPTRFILEDANGRGVLVEGTLAVTPNGAATLKITKGEWDGGLRVPVKAYGNVLDVTRGETVQDEVLGSGDPTQPYQTFKLAKSPLTYLSKPNTPEGIASTLEIRVGGIRWHERPSFYGAGPNDAVYIVRHDDDQNTHVTFGDGVRGMRLPTGRGNVRANYRRGAGAAVPPAGGINQIAKNVPGLLRVHGPIVARGGSDAETSKDIRKRAPASALVLGRCVALADFAARVAGTAGVRNSKVEYAWDDASQTACVKVWYIPNSPEGDLTPQIVADLQAMSEPGTVIRAAAADPWLRFLFINLEIERDRLPADVEAAVRAALLDPEKGPLAIENTPIGAPLSRSLIVGVAKSVPGVLDVTSMYFAFDHDPIPFPEVAFPVPEGEYLDLGDIDVVRLVIGAMHAESRGCRDLVS